MTTKAHTYAERAMDKLDNMEIRQGDDIRAAAIWELEALMQELVNETRESDAKLVDSMIQKADADQPDATWMVEHIANAIRKEKGPEGP